MIQLGSKPGSLDNEVIFVGKVFGCFFALPYPVYLKSYMFEPIIHSFAL